MEKIIKLKKAHHDLIWGTEDWIISAHKNGECIVDGGQFSGISLSNLFITKKEIFGNIKTNEFPLLIKIIDAKTPLSIQVHPDDEYARKNDNSLGKTECWYILDAEENGDIIVGQKAKSREEFEKAIFEKKVMDLMEILPINKGDFFYIPAGTVHAIRKNTKILEVQQSSDITYRLYDYDRKDKYGELRELHIEKSLDVINYDYKYKNETHSFDFLKGCNITTLANEQYFIVKKLTISEATEIENNELFILGVVIKGNFVINNSKVEELESFIIPNKQNIEIIGTGEIIISYVPNK